MKVLIVGAGGIGSYIAMFLDQLIKAQQIPTNFEFCFMDDDIVDPRNLKYQNFDDLDATFLKVTALEEKYAPTRQPKSWITTEPKKANSKEDLYGYDVVVCAVDNLKFRKMMFAAMDTDPKLKDTMWWDLRAEGRQIAGFAKGNHRNLDGMLKLSQGEDAEDGSSCQRDYELQQGWIQQGNKVIALLWTQWFIDWIRGNSFVKEFHLMV